MILGDESITVHQRQSANRKLYITLLVWLLVGVSSGQLQFTVIAHLPTAYINHSDVFSLDFDSHSRPPKHACTGWGKKWNIHALRRYLLNTGFVFVDHWSRGY